MVFIENEGALFRGPNRAYPTEVWSPRDKIFKPYKGEVPKDVSWGDEISPAEAERIMAG